MTELPSHDSTPSFDLSDLTPEKLKEIVGPIDPAVFEDTITQIRNAILSNEENQQKWTAVFRIMNETLRTVGTGLRIASLI